MGVCRGNGGTWSESEERVGLAAGIEEERVRGWAGVGFWVWVFGWRIRRGWWEAGSGRLRGREEAMIGGVYYD